MKARIGFVLIPFLCQLLLAPAGAGEGGFESFQAEASKATKALRCSNAGTTPASDGMGALYGCIQGRAETVKWFINEDADRPGQVRDIKVMWNDYHRDIGEGLHADRAEAQAMVALLAKLYAPDMAAAFQTALTTNTDQIWTVGRLRITYTYFRGPAIEERLFTVVQTPAPAATK